MVYKLYGDTIPNNYRGFSVELGQRSKLTLTLHDRYGTPLEIRRSTADPGVFTWPTWRWTFTGPQNLVYSAVGVEDGPAGQVSLFIPEDDIKKTGYYFWKLEFRWPEDTFWRPAATGYLDVKEHGAPISLPLAP